jgi:hypothetical protein
MILQGGRDRGMRGTGESGGKRNESTGDGKIA